MKNKGAIVVIVLAVVTAIAVIAAGALFLKTKELEEKTAAMPTVTPFLISKEPPAGAMTQDKMVTQTPVPTVMSVANFENNVVFTPEVQAEITAKVINPFLDYYRDQYNAGYVKKLTITKNIESSSDTYPYKGTYVFEANVNGGFLINMVNGAVDWWTPECLNGCTYSAMFKEKYPEIVAKTQ